MRRSIAIVIKCNALERLRGLMEYLGLGIDFGGDGDGGGGGDATLKFR